MRERSPFKADYPTHKLAKGRQWREMATNWGRILAASHLRGARALYPVGPSTFADAVISAGLARFEAFDELFGSMAFAYADCVRNDHQAFAEAIKLSAR